MTTTQVEHAPGAKRVHCDVCKVGNQMDDLGLYPVGYDCARTLKKNGVQLYDWDFNPI